MNIFVEKPKDPEVQKKFVSRDDPERPFLGSMGIYMFQTKVLNDLLTYHLRSDDFGGDIIPEAIQSHNVYGYDFDGYWEDIGSSMFQPDLLQHKNTSYKGKLKFLVPRSFLSCFPSPIFPL